MGWKVAAIVVLLVLCLGTSAAWGQTGTVEEAEQLNQQLIQLYRQGNYVEAVRLGERTLAIREKVLGPEHPDTATTLNNLAVLYEGMGEMATALPLHQRALAIQEKVLGPEHPDTAQSLNNLAALYRTIGEVAQALPLYQRALAIFEKALVHDQAAFSEIVKCSSGSHP